LSLPLLQLQFFWLFSAQKSHVKPTDHLTLYQSATSVWRIPPAQSGIIEIEVKERALAKRRGFAVEKEIALKPLIGRI
jgi:hypothetical protein